MHTYPVDGRSRSQWATRMRENGPRDPVTGRRYSGYAEWQVTWSWQSWPLEDGQCQLGYWDVVADITITLPDWTGRDRAPAALAAQWDRFISALAAHEQVHARHGEQAAAAVRDMFAELPTELACEGSRARIDRRARAIIDEYRRLDRRFDRETRHGMLP
nr:DUF922 domain-containing protein [Lysobacter chinensis]